MTLDFIFPLSSWFGVMKEEGRPPSASRGTAAAGPIDLKDRAGLEN